MPRGIIGHGWRRPVPGARPRDRAVALIGEFSVSASEEHPSSRYTAGRIASAVSKTKRSFHDKLMAASSTADAVRSAERRLKIKVEYALKAVYELRCQLRPV